MGKEVPILFNGDMVRSILRKENPKTQTRRPIKGIPRDCSPEAGAAYYCPHRFDVRTGEAYPGSETFGIWGDDWDIPAPCAPGDTLWVRETWAILSELRIPLREKQPVAYCADCDHRENIEDYTLKPSIHMPRWACRTFLPVVSVRAERVCDITEADAVAEGFADRAAFLDGWLDIYGPNTDALTDYCWVFEWKEVRRG